MQDDASAMPASLGRFLGMPEAGGGGLFGKRTEAPLWRRLLLKLLAVFHTSLDPIASARTVLVGVVVWSRFNVGDPPEMRCQVIGRFRVDSYAKNAKDATGWSIFSVRTR
jgi:hypothetical protein